MATKKKKTASKRTTKNAAAKSAKPKADELCTFAIRIPPVERDAIHKAAGPARASKFVRAVALAAAREDTKAYQEALKEAREARS